MKRNWMILCWGALVVGVAWGSTPQSYTLSIPGAPVIRNTSDATNNVWLASNNVASVAALFGPTNATPISLAGTPGLPRYTETAAEAGFSVERIKPEVWLGDAITPPEEIEVDWVATYAEYGTNADEQAQFIFDNIHKVVYTQAGGALTFRWIATDGTVTPRVYIASGATSGRPFKMYWTEAPWNAPVINLSGKGSFFPHKIDTAKTPTETRLVCLPAAYSVSVAGERLDKLRFYRVTDNGAHQMSADEMK